MTYLHLILLATLRWRFFTNFCFTDDKYTDDGEGSCQCISWAFHVLRTELASSHRR